MVSTRAEKIKKLVTQLEQTCTAVVAQVDESALALINSSSRLGNSHLLPQEPREKYTRQSKSQA